MSRCPVPLLVLDKKVCIRPWRIYFIVDMTWRSLASLALFLI
jgi:hypothetical protein